MTLPAFAVIFLLSAAAWTFLPAALCLVLLFLLLGGGLASGWFRSAGGLLWALIFLWCGGMSISRPGHLSRHPNLESGSARLRFVVSGDPVPAPGRTSEDGVRIPVRIQDVFDGTWKRGHGRVMLQQEAGLLPEGLLIGSRWEATGRIRALHGPHTGLFRSTHRFTPDPGSWQIRPSGPGSRGAQLLFGMRHHLLNRLERLLPHSEAERAVLQALLLGDRSDLTGSRMDRFARTGLVHLFAVSGLHIGMLAWMGWAVLRRCGVGLRTRAAVLAPFLMVFVWFSGMGASSLRAIIMLLSLWGAPYFYRRCRVLHAISLSVCIILAISPQQVRDIGFQFSFLLVAGLLAFASSSFQFLEAKRAPDPWAPPDAFRSWRERILWSRLFDGLVVSAWCLLLSAPLTAYHFNLFSPVGLLGNLLAVPLVFLLLLTGFPCLFLTLLLPGELVRMVWVLPRMLATLLLEWTALLESLPYAWQWVTAPSLWMVLIGYGFLFASKFRPLFWRPCLAGITGLVLLYSTQRLLDMATPQLWMLPTERGQSFFLRHAFTPGILIDAGSEWEGWLISRELQHKGVDHLAAVVFTHPDPRHVGGWPTLQENLRCTEALVAAVDSDAVSESFPGDVTELQAGDCLERGGWTLEVLHPSSAVRASSGDERSLVIRATSGFQSVLFMGGAGQSVEVQLLQTEEGFASRVLCAGHPRSGPLLHPAFLDAVDPDGVLFSGERFEGVSPERRHAEQRTAERGISFKKSDVSTSFVLKLR